MYSRESYQPFTVFCFSANDRSQNQSPNLDDVPALSLYPLNLIKDK